MDIRVKRGIFAGLLGLGLTAGAWAQGSIAITEPKVPLLPASFGEWKMEEPVSIILTPPASGIATSAPTISLTTVSKEALEECGPQRSQVANYIRAGQTLHVEAIEFGDRTGAFSAYTLVKRSDMTPRKGLGSDAAVGDGAVLFTVGTSVVLAQPAGAEELAGLKPLVDGLPKAMGNKGVAALLPTLIPEKGLVAGSERYALGAATYAAEGGVLPAQSLGWEKSAEAVTAKYADRRGQETLTMLLYPTPMIAGNYTRTVEQETAALGPSFAGAKVRREGELVLLASGTFSGDEAQHMIENIHLKQQVTVNDNVLPEPTQHEKIVQTYSLLTNIAILAGVLMTAAVLLGLFLGFGRAGYRILRGQPAYKEPEFLSLHLDPQNKAPDFGPPQV